MLAFYGGTLIGFAGLLLLFFNGRILGVSGIVSGVFENSGRERRWRVAFLAGVLFGGVLVRFLNPSAFTFALERSNVGLALAGLLVGIGTRMSNGCTSGHGVCGISRFSNRSLLATLTFMGMGVLMVTIINRFFGGAI